MSKKNKFKKIVFDENKLKFYYGIPHCHSKYSTGKGDPAEIYEFASKCNLNFLFLTDHNNSLATPISSKDSTLKWRVSKTIYNKIKRNHSDFIPILGFECKTVPFGDFNIINSKNIFSGTVRDLRFLTIWMMNNPNSFISINHPHKSLSLLPYYPIYNQIITSIEVFNGNPDSKIVNHEKYYFLLLDRGWKLGAINGQDNHKINFDKSESLTTFIGNELSKDSLIEAFKNRRTYSTQSKTLKMYFKVDDYFMGETARVNKSKIKFYIFAQDLRYKIDRIEIISNKNTIIKSLDDVNLNDIKYIYEHIIQENETWYVVKIYQEFNKIAISSPIFIIK